MGWFIALGCVVVFVIVVAATIGINRGRFQRRLAREEVALLLSPADGISATSNPRAQSAAELPVPVARFQQLAAASPHHIKTLRLRHHGTFCMSTTAKPAPIVGQQLFTSEPPGFIWSGRIQLFAGVWVRARDMCVGGIGSMRVLLEDTVPLVNARGPEIDQGSALRLLAEMAWYPSAFFDRRWVSWQPIDASHARATLRTGAQEVSAIFEFGGDGLLVGMHADRFMDKAGLTPWGGIYRDWRSVSGMRIPYDVDVWWQLGKERFTYAHWVVDSVTFNDGPAHG